jgi:predicted Fe-Mo cluster-binding NifX family protein
MKIAVATNDFVTVAGHVGRCRGFVIYEVNDKGEITNKKNVENTFTNHHAGEEHHAHGHAHSQAHAEGTHNRIAEGIEFADYLVCRAAGPGLVNSLAANGIRTVFSKIDSADEAVKLLVQNALPNDESECEH